jgi:hypothetical protein
MGPVLLLSRAGSNMASAFVSIANHFAENLVALSNVNA